MARFPRRPGIEWLESVQGGRRSSKPPVTSLDGWPHSARPAAIERSRQFALLLPADDCAARRRVDADIGLAMGAAAGPDRQATRSGCANRLSLRAAHKKKAAGEPATPQSFPTPAKGALRLKPFATFVPARGVRSAFRA